MFTKIKDGIQIGLGIVIVLAISGITYASYNALITVESGDPLIKDSWNQMITNQADFNTRLNNMSSLIPSGIPSGAVIAFNAEICPDEWSKADGTDSPLDLRGEFIRGWDDGKGVDNGRALSSFQKSSEIPPGYGPDGVLPLTDVLNGDYTTIYSAGYREVTGAWSISGIDFGYYGIRPRNIALLYCIKD